MIDSDIISLTNTFLQSLPDIDWNEYRNVISKLITQEKTRRLSFCIICITDIDELERRNRHGRMTNIKMRRQILSGELKCSPKILHEFVCKTHWDEYNLPGLIAARQEQEDQRKLEQMQLDQYWRSKKNYFSDLKQKHIAEFVESRGRRGEATPYQAYNYVIEPLTESDFNALAAMPYREFLNTSYWWAVSRYKKYRSGSCELCNSTTHLHAHHRTYKNRGREVFHLNDLTVLCSDCHAKHHEKLSQEAK